MNTVITKFKEIKWWLRVVLFYSIILVSTYFARKLPNILQITLSSFTDIDFPWNYNHGIAILIVSLLFYKFSGVKSEFSLLGANKLKAIAFPVILLIGYSAYGFKNDYGINEHLWAFIFCMFTLIYDIMEEYTWRGFLIEGVGHLNLIIKSVISGIFWAIWHLLVFNNFDQFGGFAMFLAFCLIFSLILTFSVLRTKAIIVPATLHALLIRTNIVTLLCFLLYAVLLFTWNRKRFVNIDN